MRSHVDLMEHKQDTGCRTTGETQKEGCGVENNHEGGDLMLSRDLHVSRLLQPAVQLIRKGKLSELRHSVPEQRVSQESAAFHLAVV